MDIFVMIVGLLGVVYLCDLAGEKVGAWLREISEIVKTWRSDRAKMRVSYRDD